MTKHVKILPGGHLETHLRNCFWSGYSASFWEGVNLWDTRDVCQLFGRLSYVAVIYDFNNETSQIEQAKWGCARKSHFHIHLIKIHKKGEAGCFGHFLYELVAEHCLSFISSCQNISKNLTSNGFEIHVGSFSNDTAPRARVFFFCCMRVMATSHATR